MAFNDSVEFDNDTAEIFVYSKIFNVGLSGTWVRITNKKGDEKSRDKVSLRSN